MMRAILYRVSLLQALAVMIVISLLLPLPLLMLIYANSTYLTKQEAFNVRTTKKFHLTSEIFLESLWKHDSALGQKMLQHILLDQSVQFAYVKDSDGALFLGWENREKLAKNDDTFLLHKSLEKDNRVVGTLEMGFAREDLLSSIRSDMALFGTILFLQVLFLVLVISWIYYYKIIKPIRRLVGHSHLLADQKLDEPFVWDENDEIGTLGLALDKTRIKLKNLFDALKEENEVLDVKVKQRTQELEDTSRYKSEFLANMSHEIRTPMNAIMGMSHLLGKTALNATQSSYVGKIKEASSVLLRIINDILDFSKIEAGKMNLECVVFDLHKELKKSCSIFSVLAKEKGIDFQCDYLETNRFFKGDPCKIMQIINNFLSNAIKFTKEGAVILTLHETINDDASSTLFFDVRDTGIGISKEKQSLLFQAFSQLDTSVTRKFGGTGLGLYICMQLASMMQGKITVESEEGRGSLFGFSLQLPLAKGIELHQENASLSFEPLRILLIEDENNTRENLSEFIRSFGFFLTTKKSSESVASTLLEASLPYHLLLVDYELLGLNGIEFYEKLLSQVPLSQMPLVAMMATNDDAELKNRIFNAGIKSFLKKPINPSMLYDELVSLCSVVSHTPLFDPSKIDLSSKRILVVEDNDINLEVATYLLKEMHVKVHTARNGLEAVELIQEQEHPYDLILMDVQMPLMDGYEATRIIRKELHSLTPIVAMTANVMVHDIEKCMQSGMDAHIGKPFEVEDFYGTLLEVLHVSLSISPKQALPEVKKRKQRFGKREAIDKLGGNEALWQKLFIRFYDTYMHLPESLKDLVAKQELTPFVDYTHTTKGLCGTLGLFKLEEAFASLEHYLKESSAPQNAPIELVLSEYEALKESMRNTFESCNVCLIQPVNSLQESTLSLSELLLALKEALLISNVSKVNQSIEALSSYSKIRENKLFKEVVIACKHFDFEKALEILAPLSEENNHG